MTGDGIDADMASWYPLAVENAATSEDNQRVSERSVPAALLRLVAFAVVLGSVLSVAIWIVARQADDAWCRAEVYRRGVLVEAGNDRDWRSSEELGASQRSQVRCEPGKEPYLVER